MVRRSIFPVICLALLLSVSASAGPFSAIRGKIHPIKTIHAVIDGEIHKLIPAPKASAACPAVGSCGGSLVSGPGDFRPPMPSQFRGGYGGWGSGWRGPMPYVNPFNFVAPLVVNYATAPRMVLNPMTGQSQLMSPGQWTVINAGTPQQAYTWTALPAWPLLGSTSVMPTAPAVEKGKIRGFVKRLFHRRSKGRLRKVIKAIRHSLHLTRKR